MRKLKTTVAVIFGILSSQTSWADTHVLDKEKSEALLTAEAANGIDLPSKAEDSGKTKSQIVADSVSVTAVLLTYDSIRRLFGAEIAKTYAAVQLTISNKSPDAAFVVHSAYIDVSQWAGGGVLNKFRNPVVAAQAGDKRPAGNSPDQISSVEARLARGQLLDAQQWSARNWTVRLLTVAGSLASGYSFAFKEIGLAKGIAAFNGNLVPGVAFAWPDGTIPQLNRISDFGFQTNKVIGKDSSDVMVCFFPINIFLSGPFKDIYRKSPAVFLSPFQILFDTQFKKTLKELGLTDTERLKSLLPCAAKALEPKREVPNPSASSLLVQAEEVTRKACEQKISNPSNADALLQTDFLGRISLRYIGVNVDGIMTVDVALVPAAIDEITFAGDASKPDFWAAAGEKKGSILCRFCTGGTVDILDAAALGITEIKTTVGADEKHLSFTFKLTKPIDAGQALNFVIVKHSDDAKKGSQEVKSTVKPYMVGYVPLTPTITGVTISNARVTVTGTNFLNTAANKLTVALHAEGGKEKDVPIKLPNSQFGDTIAFDVPADLAPGCWNVDVTVGAMTASELNQSSARILVAAKPTLTSATRSAGSVIIVGTQLVDTSKCGGSALQFQLLKDGSTTPVNVAATLQSPTGAALQLPTDAATGKWTVRLLQGTTVASTTELK